MPTNVVVPEPSEDLDWEGVWSSGSSYVPGDVVFREGSSYRALEPSTNQDPLLATGHWEMVASKGDQGPAGPQGPAGAPGAAPQAFVWEQGPSAEVWVIPHNLGYDPNYSAEDSAGTPMEGIPSWPVYGQIMHITFKSARGGKARLS